MQYVYILVSINSMFFAKSANRLPPRFVFVCDPQTKETTMRSRHQGRLALAATATIATFFASISASLTPSASAALAEAPTIRSAAGPTAADIAQAVNAFRTDLGGGSTPAANGLFGGVRREINWDGVPDQFSSPNDFPNDFFNTRSPRGVEFSTPGLNFQVSANAASGTKVRFGNVNPIYVKDFGVFSPERLFSAISSTQSDVKFFLPGTKTSGVVRGFGSVFTDVDSAKSTYMEFYDQADQLIVTIPVPASPGDGTQSFAGAVLPGDARIARVHIVAGGQTLSNGTQDSEQPSRDKVAMDDFIFGEPIIPVVAPPTVATTKPADPSSTTYQPAPTIASRPTPKPATRKLGAKPVKAKKGRVKGATTTPRIASAPTTLEIAPTTTSIESAPTTQKATPGTTTLPKAAAGPAIAKVASNPLGDILTGSDGLTLYAFTKDVAGVPTCVGACANAWPPALVSGTLNLGELPNKTLFTVVARPDGSQQLKVGKWPVYFFAGDSAPGETNGQNSGGSWFVISKAGELIK
jgi:predicted lipoprotein with Yx(FWY)xxD motif